MFEPWADALFISMHVPYDPHHCSLFLVLLHSSYPWTDAIEQSIESTALSPFPFAFDDILALSIAFNFFLSDIWIHLASIPDH